MKRQINLQIWLLVMLLSACRANNSTYVPQMDGKTWVLTTHNDTQPIAGRQPTLEFDADQVSGTTGCNHYGGTYHIEGDSIRFEGIFSTEMACLEPEGLMDQERIYLELLMVANQYKMNAGMLTLFAGSNPILIFEIQSDEPVLTEPTLEPVDPVAIDVVTPTTAPVFMPPEGFHQYQDPATGISIYIPDTWIVTDIIEGQYAILQSYPEDKYIGGEGLKVGDTKCDLNLNPTADSVDNLVQQWETSSITSILSEEEIVLNSGNPGTIFVIDSLGRLTTIVTEVDNQLVIFSCWGEFELFNQIAVTLHASNESLP